MTDLPEANAQCLSLFGTVLLTTLEVLTQNDLFTPASNSNPIRNISLVISQYFSLEIIDSNSKLCDRNETGWLIEVVKMADEHHVEIEGVFGIEETKTLGATAAELVDAVGFVVVGVNAKFRRAVRGRVADA